MTNKSWDQDREKLRELLKELRKEKAGLTQVELSKALKKPQSYVSKYEIGERRLDYVEVNDICKALGTSIEDFSRLYEGKVNSFSGKANPGKTSPGKSRKE